MVLPKLKKVQQTAPTRDRMFHTYILVCAIYTNRRTILKNFEHVEGPTSTP